MPALQRRYTRPDKTGYAKAGRRAADLPAVDAWRTMEEVWHADAVPAERRRAPQTRTAKEINSSARLSQMSAQLLSKYRTEPPRSAHSCSAVVLARGVERRLCGKSWYGHCHFSSCFRLSGHSE